MSKKGSFFGDDAEIIESKGSFFGDDAEIVEQQPEEKEVGALRKLQAAAVGLGQGATMGALDEITAAMAAPFVEAGETISELIPGTSANIDKQLRKQGFTGSALENKGLVDTYKDIRDTTRAEEKQLREESPYTVGAGELIGGIAVPGMGTVGSVGKGATMLGKMGRGAAVGAGQGALGGLGYSEAEDLEGLAKDTATGALIGGVTGGGLPIAGAALRKTTDTAKKATGKLGDLVKSTEIGETFLDAVKYTKEGQGILGKKNYEKIIDESKKLVKEKVIPLVKDQDTTLGKTIGKIYKKLENSKGEVDFSKELNSAEKQITNLIKTKKVITPEQKSNLDSLRNLISDLKQTQVKIVPTKQQKDAVQKAVDSIKNKTNKIAANSKEVGERVSFSEPKIDLDNGTVTVFDSVSGKAITENIKYGTMTPIKYQEVLKDTPLKVGDLRSIKEGAGQIGKQAKDAGLGIAQKPSFSLASSADDAIDSIAQKEGLSRALSDTNLKFKAIKEVQDLLPADVKGQVSEDNINKISQLFRKADIEGIGGDNLRDRLQSVYTQMEKSGIKKDVIESLKNSVEGISKRYELARSAKQTFGTGLLGTGKSAAVFGGALTGGTLNKASKIIQPVKNVANKIGQFSDDQLTRMSTGLSSSQNKGVQALGKQLQFALQQEGPIKNAAIWSLSQQPAFREATRQFLNEGEEATSDVIGTDPMTIGEPARVPQGQVEDQVSVQDSGQQRGVGSLTPEKLEAVKKMIAQKESSGRDKIVNKLGYSGKYQFGAQAMEDLGYLKPGSYENEKNSALDNPANFTGKDGITSKEEFLNNSELQDLVMDRSLKRNFQLLKRKGVNVESMEDADLAGALSAAHLQGAGGASKLLRKGNDTKDAFGTRTSDYLKAGKDTIQKLEKDLNRHEKYVNSGGSAVYSATGESMLGDIEQIEAPEEFKDEMKDAVVDGNIAKLKQLLADLKSNLGE